MPDHQVPAKGYRTFALVLLTIVYGFNFIDRQILGILAPYVMQDLGLSGTQMGLLLGLSFAMFYSTIAIPIAWLADRYNRVTILSVSLATWSAFTAFTGYANNFVQILMARMGVGIGEAGGSPPSHSMISDLYPKEERAGALGIYSIGIPIGIMSAYLASASLLGADQESVNWRRIFIILGVTGIVLAVIVRLLLREPVRGATDIGENQTFEQPPFKQALNSLLRIPSWWYMAFGIALGSFVSYAFAGFQTTLIRELDPNYSMQKALVFLGIINGTTYAGGTYLGAKLADKWGSKNIRAYGWIPAISISVSLVVGIITIWMPTVPLHLMSVTALLFFLGMYLGPSFAIAQTLAPINMRAMSTALFFFILNIIALGGGPTFAGWMMDVFGADNSRLDAIRYALSATCIMFVPSIVCFWVVSRKIPQDWAAAEARNQSMSR